MSRIGKQPVEIPAKTKVEVKGQTVYVEGPKGKLEWTVPSPIKVEVKEGKVVASTTQMDRVGKSRWGLSRSLIANMVRGVNEGYMKKLTVEGSTPGSRSLLRKLPVVQIMGKHSREEVCLLPSSRLSASVGGSTAAFTPLARHAAASA